MNSFAALYPLLIIVAGALFVLLLEAFWKRENKDHLAYISILFLILGAATCILSWNQAYSYFDGNLVLGKFALFFSLILT